jgi:hypothetical protein
MVRQGRQQVLNRISHGRHHANAAIEDPRIGPQIPDKKNPKPYPSVRPRQGQPGGIKTLDNLSLYRSTLRLSRIQMVNRVIFQPSQMRNVNTPIPMKPGRVRHPERDTNT